MTSLASVAILAFRMRPASGMITTFLAQPIVLRLAPLALMAAALLLTACNPGNSTGGGGY